MESICRHCREKKRRRLKQSSVPYGTGTRSIPMAMTTENVWAALDSLLDYGKNCGLLHPLDETFARNTLLSQLH